MHWYDDLPHVGYDIDGKKVLHPARGDELDKFLKTVDDTSAWFVYRYEQNLLLTPSTGRPPSTKLLKWISLSRTRNLTSYKGSMQMKIQMRTITRMNQ